MTLLILLIVFGLIFLMIEFLLTPGVGIAGIGGLACLAGACYLAFVQFDTVTGCIITASCAILIIISVIWALKTNMWKKIALKTNIESTVAPKAEQMVENGQKGIATSRLAPMGSAQFGDMVLEVKSVSGMVDPGQEVEVCGFTDNTILVKR